MLCQIANAMYRTPASESGQGAELNWSPLQLYAVSERLKTPCPPLNTDDKRW